MTPTKPKYPEVKITNFDEPCAASINCFSFSTKKVYQKKWLKGKKLYEANTNLGDRIVTPVTMVGDANKIVYFMDIITGSLYDSTTYRCLTSINIKMKKPVLKRELATTLLERVPEVL